MRQHEGIATSCWQYRVRYNLSIYAFLANFRHASNVSAYAYMFQKTEYLFN